MQPTKEVARSAKLAALEFRKNTAGERNLVLKNIASEIRKRREEILAANALDLENAKSISLSASMLDRLTLNLTRIEAMAKTAEDIAAQDEVVGQIVEDSKLKNGLHMRRERIPLGVIAMIFESRPNVVIDCACLAIKSGNAIILKGGKESSNSNHILTQIVRQALQGIIPVNIVQLVDSKEAVAELITLKDEIDVVIPRGGEQLIRYIYDNSKVPVIAHFRGLCHIYVHDDADIDMAKRVCLNAKIQRPGVCNAMESLLLNKNLPQEFILELLRDFSNAEVEIRASENVRAIFPAALLATENDFATEYLEKKLSVKMVESIDAAIAHIQKYGTHHTECICSSSPQVIAKFQREVDASCLMVNTSTRFNDGGELGLGAELGISTSKIHAYGPMGAREMTTLRFLVESAGKIRN